MSTAYNGGEPETLMPCILLCSSFFRSYLVGAPGCFNPQMSLLEHCFEKRPNVYPMFEFCGRSDRFLIPGWPCFL